MDLFKRSFERTRAWYARFERPISSISLIGGFVFDALTLHRVDQLWDNLWVGAHLFIVGICILLMNRKEAEPGAEKDPGRAHFWYVNILQFFFGGLLSTYLVFYFRSGSIASSWPFILFLALAFWANESFKRRYVRVSFQISLFYLSIFVFAIYILPVIIHSLGVGTFILSGVASLVFMWFFLIVLVRVSGASVVKHQQRILLGIGIVFAVINLLYFTNIIPPIPLSLTDDGVYHNIIKTGDLYTVTAEKTSWRDLFDFSPSIHVGQNDPVYVYSAVFSPTDFNTTIVHDWEYEDGSTGGWTDVSRVSLAILGGRDTGYRTFSVRSGLSPGNWRVNVETERGQIIGTVRFTVVAGEPASTVTSIR